MDDNLPKPSTGLLNGIEMDLAEPEPIQTPAVPPVATPGPSLDLETQSNLVPLFKQAKTVDPARAATVTDLSRKTGEPIGYVDSNLDHVKKIVSTPPPSYFDDLEKRYPGTTRFLGTPANMVSAQDSIPHLKDLEDGIDAHHRGQGTISAIWDFNKSSAARLDAAVARAPSQIAEILNELGPSVHHKYGDGTEAFIPLWDALTKSKLELDNEHIGGTAPPNNAVSNYFEKLSAYELPNEAKKSVTEAWGSGDKAEAMRLMAVQGFGGITGILPYLTGPTAAGFTLGENYQKAREAGAEPLAALPNAALKATATIGLYKLFAAPAIQSQIESIKTAYGTGAAADFARTFGKNWLHASGVMTLFSEGQQVADDFVDYAYRVNPNALDNQGQKAYENIINSLLPGALFGFGGAAGEKIATKFAKKPAEAPGVIPGTDQPTPAKLGPEIPEKPGSGPLETAPELALGKDVVFDLANQEAAAQHTRENFLDYGKIVTDMPMGKRSPEDVKAHLSEITAGKAPADLFFPIDDIKRLYQGKGVDPEAFFESLAPGAWADGEVTGDIRVDAPTFISKLAGTPEFKELADHVKLNLDPEAKTTAQIDRTKADWLEADKNLKAVIPETEKILTDTIKAKQDARAAGQKKKGFPGFAAVANMLKAKLQAEKPNKAIQDPKKMAQYFARQYQVLAMAQAKNPGEAPGLFKEYVDRFRTTITNLDKLDNGEQTDFGGIVSHLTYMKRNGQKLLIEKPNVTAMVGGEKEQALKNWRARVADARSAGIPYTTNPNARGARTPSDLAENWFQAVLRGELPKDDLYYNAAPEEASAGKDATTGRPDANHDDILEAIRNSANLDRGRHFQEGLFAIDENQWLNVWNEASKVLDLPISELRTLGQARGIIQKGETNDTYKSRVAYSEAARIAQEKGVQIPIQVLDKMKAYDIQAGTQNTMTFGREIERKATQEGLFDNRGPQGSLFEAGPKFDLSTSDYGQIQPESLIINEKGPKNEKSETYQQDLFGNPVSRPKASNRVSGSRPGKLQPENQKDKSTYFTKTKLIKKSITDIGVSKITGPHDLARATAYLADRATEGLEAILTDKDGTPIAMLGGFKGMISGAPMEVPALLMDIFRVKGAAHLWLSHNHPSGKSELSGERGDVGMMNLLTKALEGSGIEPMGIMAVTPRRGTEGQKFSWKKSELADPTKASDAHNLINNTLDNELIPTTDKKTASFKIPNLDRIITEMGDKSPELNDPNSVMKYLRMNGFSTNPGILVLTYQGEPAGFIPLEKGEMLKLRAEGRMDRLYRSLSVSNAGAVVINTGGYISDAEVKNIAAFIAGARLNLLDVVDIPNTTSWGAEGKMIESYGQPRSVLNRPPTFFQGPRGNAPAFYSRLQRTIESKMPNTATVSQIEGILKDQNQEERKWSGIDDFLKGKDKVSKVDLLDFLRANQLEIKEIQKGGYENDDAKVAEIEKLGYSLEEDETSGQAALLTNTGGSVTDMKTVPPRVIELLKQINEEVDAATKFERWQLPGGENYREQLFQLPPKQPIKELPSDFKVYEQHGNWYVEDKDRESVANGRDKNEVIQRAIKLVNIMAGKSTRYNEGHFEEPDILAHARLNDRTDTEGKKILFAEEIQSDWHQRGRKEGYVADEGNVKKLGPEWIVREMPDNPGNFEVVDDANGVLVEAYPTKESAEKAAIDHLNRVHDRIHLKVPDAPFRKTWQEFVLKRLIREAAEKGYDKIGWTTGEQQAERYDLSKQISKIVLTKGSENGGPESLYAYGLNGNQVLAERMDKGKSIEDYIGKDVAKKFEGMEFSEPGPNNVADKVLTGLDLKVGGEGMKGFYDKIIPDYLNKFGKKYGAKVAESKIEVADPNVNYRYAGPEYTLEELEKGYEVINKTGSNRTSPFTGEEQDFPVTRVANSVPLRRIIEKMKAGTSYKDALYEEGNQGLAEVLGGEMKPDPKTIKPTTIHTLELTPALKEAALNEGFSLFQGPEENRGGMEPAYDPESGKLKGFHVFVNENSDGSTLFHELAHQYLFILNEIANDPGASETILKMRQDIFDWFKVKDFTQITRKHHEMFARGAEYRLWEGNIPVPGLKEVFDTFMKWMRKAYPTQALMEDYLGFKFTPKIRDIYDRMMASQEEIEQAKRDMGYNPELPPDLSPEIARRIIRVEAEADSEALDGVLKPMMKELTPLSKEHFRKQESMATEVATREIKESGVYKAMDELRKRAISADLIAPKINQGDLSGIPEETLAAFEEEAIKNGFHDFGDLAAAITGAMLEYDAIQAKREEIMSQYVEIKDSPAVKDLAVKSVHSEKGMEALALRIEALRDYEATKQRMEALSKGGPVFAGPGDIVEKKPAFVKKTPAEIKAARDKALSDMAYAKQQAKPLLGGKTWLDSGNYRIYLTAERNDAVKAEQARLRGDYKMADVYRRRRLLNYALAREALKNREEIAKALKKIIPFVKRGEDLMGMKRGFITQLDGLLDRSGVGSGILGQEEWTKKKALRNDGALHQLAEEMENPPDGGPGASIEEIAAETGLRKGSNGNWRDESPAEFLKRMDPAWGLNEAVDERFLGGTDLSGPLTLDDLRDLKTAMMAIAHAGKKENKGNSANYNLGMAECAHYLAEAIRKNVGKEFFMENRMAGEKFHNPIVQKLYDLSKLPDVSFSSSLYLESLAKVVDGEKDEAGPFHRYVVWTLRDAMRDEGEIHRERFDGLKAIKAKYFQSQKEALLAGDNPVSYLFSRKEVTLAGIKQTLSLENILNLARHWGSVTGRQRVIDGFGTNPEEVMKILNDHLEKKHWDYLQARADFDKQMWPKIVKNRMDFMGVEVDPLELAPIETKFGTYPGWYAHVKYDPKKSNEAFQHAEVNAAQGALSMNPSVSAGFTKKRFNRIKDRPLRLDDGVYYEYMEEMIHMLAYTGAVQDVNRILRNRDLASALKDAFGTKLARLPGEQLKYMAGKPPDLSGPGERIINFGRVSTIILYVGFRLPIFPIKYFTDNSRMLRAIGPKRWATTMWDYNFNPGRRAEINAFVDSTDPLIKQSGENFNYDLATFSRQWNDPLYKMKMLIYCVERIADRNVRKPMFYEIYKHNLYEHGHEGARNIAGQAVDRALSTGSPLYHNAWQRGGALSKSLAAAKTFAFAMFNDAWASGKIAGLKYEKGNTGAACLIMGTALASAYVVPALIYWAVREMTRNPIHQGNDEDKWKRLASKVITEPFEGLPPAGEIAHFGMNLIHGGRKQDLHLTPVDEAYEKMGMAAYDIGKGIFGEKLSEGDAEDLSTGVMNLLQAPDYLQMLAFNFWDDFHDRGDATFRDLLTRKTKH